MSWILDAVQWRLSQKNFLAPWCHLSRGRIGPFLSRTHILRECSLSKVFVGTFLEDTFFWDCLWLLFLDNLESDRHCQLPILVHVVIADLCMTLVVDKELFVWDAELFGIFNPSNFIHRGDLAVEGMA